MTHLDTDLGELALHAARAGAAAIRAALRDGALDVGRKSAHNDLVTNADRAAERAVVAAIREHRPQDTILGEESGEHPGEHQGGVPDAGPDGARIRWLVDPVDGTTNFVHRRWDYAVSVAAERGGRSVAGAILRPAYQDWVLAGGGAARGSAGVPAVAGTERTTDALVSVGFPHRPELRPRVLHLLERLGPHIRDFRRIGSACCDLLSVATGVLDAYIGVEQAPWDVAAGAAIVPAAGGRCGVLRTGRGMSVFLAGTPAVYAGLERLLAADPS